MVDGILIKKILKATSLYFKPSLGGYRHIAFEAMRNDLYLHINTPLFHFALRVGTNKGMLHRGYYYVYSTASGHGNVTNNKHSLAQLKKMDNDSSVSYSGVSILFNDIKIPTLFKKGYSPISGSWTGIRGSGDISKLSRFHKMYDDNENSPLFQRVVAIDPDGWAASAHYSHMLKIEEYAASERIYIAIGSLQFLPLLGACKAIGICDNTTLCSFDNGLITTTFSKKYPDPHVVMPNIKTIDLLDWTKAAEFSLSKRTLSRIDKMGDVLSIWNDDGMLYLGSESDKIELDRYSNVPISEEFHAKTLVRFFKMCAKNEHHMTLHMKISRDVPGVGKSEQSAFFSHRGISWICMPVKK